MKARSIYLALSGESWWAQQSQAMRWLAARYYAGVETLAQLRSHGQPRPVSKSFELPSQLTARQVEDIIGLR